jgi:hypothetical protein
MVPKSRAKLGIQAYGLKEHADRVATLIDADDPEVSEIAAALRSLAHVIESTQIVLAEEMREQGCSWADVGKAFGISRQAAHERFS